MGQSGFRPVLAGDVGNRQARNLALTHNQIARLHLNEVEARIERLRALKRELTRIVSSCAGGRTAECRIIEALADHGQCETPTHEGRERKAKKSSKHVPKRK